MVWSMLHKHGMLHQKSGKIASFTLFPTGHSGEMASYIKVQTRAVSMINIVSNASHTWHAAQEINKNGQFLHFYTLQTLEQLVSSQHELHAWHAVLRVSKNGQLYKIAD